MASAHALLGLGEANPVETVRALEKGLSTRNLGRLKAALDVSWDELARLLQMAPRTLKRRQQAGRLQTGESERALRIARTFDLALQLFEGDARAARDWLSRPRAVLGGRAPLDFAITEPGARAVEELIGRLEAGVFS